ncbi:MAG: NTPase [Planctomycetota bacterium]
MSMVPRILITGKPGCGKTTLVERVSERLGSRAGGFISREIREKGRRIGFSLHTLDGAKGLLAHVDCRSRHRVGKYGIHLEDLERIAVPAIQKAAEERLCVIIDEIARMELFSKAFREAVLLALDAPVPLLATLQVRRDPFLDALRSRDDLELITLTTENRDALRESLARRMLSFWNE